MRLTVAVLVVSLGMSASLWTAQAGGQGTKYAFLVGCSDYDKTQLRALPYTIADVEGFRKALEATGYQADYIVMLHDKMPQTRYRPHRNNILKELRLLLGGMRAEDMVVVALSGHGLHFKGEKTGFFCPVDARIDDKSTLIAMDGNDSLFEILKACRAKQKLLVVNACRNDPTTDLALAAQKVQIDDEDADEVPDGIAAIYSCRQGQKSYYDPDRKLSLFYDHLIRAWKGEYHKSSEKLKLEYVLDQVVLKTKVDANKTLGALQVPEVRREYKGEWLVGEGGLALSKHLELELGGGQKLKLVRVEPGSFQMGSPPGEEDRSDDELLHTVEISKPFYMGIHEVTRGQFRMFVQAESFQTDADKSGGFGYNAAANKFDEGKPGYSWRNPGFPQTDDHPVQNMSWNDANAFCAWLSRNAGKTVDLPTEAEWEFACRAGTKGRFSSGNSEASLEGHVNIADRRADATLRPIYGAAALFAPFDDGYVFTAPAARFKANPWGLFDMHGNSWEWCKDWYDKDYYKDSPRFDPPGPRTGAYHVIRGGSWGVGASMCRAAYRYGNPAFYRNSGTFRVVVRLAPEAQ